MTGNFGIFTKYEGIILNVTVASTCAINKEKKQQRRPTLSRAVILHTPETRHACAAHTPADGNAVMTLFSKISGEVDATDVELDALVSSPPRLNTETKETPISRPAPIGSVMSDTHFFSSVPLSLPFLPPASTTPPPLALFTLH